MAGLTAGFVLALNPLTLQYGSSARPYALCLLLSAISTKYALTADNLPRAYSYYSLAATLLHPLSALIAPAHLAMRLIAGRPIGRMALSWCVTGLVTCPIYLISAGQTPQVAWIKPISWDQFEDQYLRAFGLPSAPEYALLAAVAILIATLTLNVNKGWTWRDNWSLISIALCLIPALELASLSYIAHPTFVDRYLISLPIGAALFAAAAIATIRKATPALAVGLALTISASATAFGGGLNPPGGVEGHPGIDAALLRQLRPGEALVIHQGLSQTGLQFGYAWGVGDDEWKSDSARDLVSGQNEHFVREVTFNDGTSVHTHRGYTGKPATVWILQTYGPRNVPIDLHWGWCTPSAVQTFGESTLLKFSCSASRVAESD